MHFYLIDFKYLDYLIMKRIFLLIFALATIVSCNKQKKGIIYDPRAVELNEKAGELMKVHKYDSALIFLDQALRLDKNYLIAYGNKAAIYIELKDFKKALTQVEAQININPNHAEAMSAAGYICDKSGDSIKALDYYKKSIEIYQNRIVNSKDSVQLVNNKINMAYLLIITGQESKGKEELKKFKEAYPNNPLINWFLNMDRKLYLKMIKDNTSTYSLIKKSNSILKNEK